MKNNKNKETNYEISNTLKYLNDLDICTKLINLTNLTYFLIIVWISVRINAKIPNSNIPSG